MKVATLIFLVLLWLFLVSQIFWPTVKGTKLFPAFSGRRKLLDNTLTELNEVEEQILIEKQIKQKTEALNKLKGEA
jgi:hypothetical protein